MYLIWPGVMAPDRRDLISIWHTTSNKTQVYRVQKGRPGVSQPSACCAYAVCFPCWLTGPELALHCVTDRFARVFSKHCLLPFLVTCVYHGLSACTDDNLLSKARGLSPRIGKTMV